MFAMHCGRLYWVMYEEYILERANEAHSLDDLSISGMFSVGMQYHYNP
jgi:hypothetical protein